MPFSYYSTEETNWINKKIKDFNLSNEELINRVNSNFEGEEVQKSINPIVVIITEIVIEKLMGAVQLLSPELQSKIKNRLDDYSSVNSITSSLESSSVFTEFKEEILIELQKKNFPEATSQLKEIENLFTTYEF